MIVKAPLADCFGNVIFCDDVRYELSDKETSYMGAYRGLIRIQGVAPIVVAEVRFRSALLAKTK